jgi:hypothetical protein
MHPTLMTLIADDRALDLRCAAAEARRGRLARTRTRRLISLRLPRRAARVAHA